jgi:uncharacterized protein (UPF0548 family)
VSVVRLLDRVDPAVALAAQRSRAVNFAPVEVDPTWRRDYERTFVGTEAPGEPEADGLWETACRLVEAYEQADPRTIRAVYDPDAPLEGRDLLLEGRFLLLRFYMGVRITEVIDRRSDGERVWGWAYETLEGHLERGRQSYEVVKNERSGRVDVVVSSSSEGAPTLGPVIGFGWKVFGRRIQARFHHECGRRLARLARERCGRRVPVPERRTVEGLVLAPSDAGRPRRALTIRQHQPG